MHEILDEVENWLDWIIILSYIPLIAEKASVRLCYWHNAFTFDQLFLKFADKVGMDDISDKFETWPDWSIRIMSSGLLKKPLFDFSSA